MAVEGAPPERRWAPTKSEALANMKNKVYVKDGRNQIGNGSADYSARL
jgi:hypothetical protein